ncbi:MAG TPA: hypothetical protein DDZ96_09150 [Porphyromonadaceae bacterium]|nr:hypothetical protein [Porphyromonadaceae bacterium]HBL33962.1 hypothetical protein [Porphyromonadaceae bacterium]HBX18881.1 hypothetical protein [Porphyromonadaceae bacterium]HCM21165.1 hypothetical protein [Porphyromonadaceae bacterium]
MIRAFRFSIYGYKIKNKFLFNPRKHLFYSEGCTRRANDLEEGANDFQKRPNDFEKCANDLEKHANNFQKRPNCSAFCPDGQVYYPTGVTVCFRDRINRRANPYALLF